MNIGWTELGVQPAVEDATFKRHLRLPVLRPFSDALAEANAWTRAWFAVHARPWICVAAGDESLHAWLAPRFAPGARLVIAAVSAGPEPESEAARRFAAGEPDHYYFLECYAAATVDTLLAGVRQRLGVARHSCPGYTGWPIGENVPLLAALGRVAALPGPLEVLCSGMLKPKKSQLAVCALPPQP